MILDSKIDKPDQADTSLSKQEFKAAIEAAGMRYEDPIIDIAALSGPIVNPAITELSEYTKEGIEDFAEAMRTWLSYPTIQDDFTTHPERREWHNTMVARFGRSFNRLSQENRLKGNPLFALMSRFEILGMELKHIPSNKLGELRDIVATVPDVSRYAEMSTEEKLALVHTVESLGVRFLKFITASEAV